MVSAGIGVRRQCQSYDLKRLDEDHAFSLLSHCYTPSLVHSLRNETTGDFLVQSETCLNCGNVSAGENIGKAVFKMASSGEEQLKLQQGMRSTRLRYLV